MARITFWLWHIHFLISNSFRCCCFRSMLTMFSVLMYIYADFYVQNMGLPLYIFFVELYQSFIIVIHCIFFMFFKYFIFLFTYSPIKISNSSNLSVLLTFFNISPNVSRKSYFSFTFESSEFLYIAIIVRIYPFIWKVFTNSLLFVYLVKFVLFLIIMQSCNYRLVTICVIYFTYKSIFNVVYSVSRFLKLL